MPQAFRRAPRPKAFLASLLLLLVVPACVSLELVESTRPFPGRQWPDVPTIAVAEARDRRPDPDRLGRVGWAIYCYEKALLLRPGWAEASGKCAHRLYWI